MSAVQRPSVFDYDDHLSFLKDKVEYFKLVKGISVRKLHERAGLKSSSYIQMVLDQKRRLGAKAATQIAKALELSGSEQKYFFLMIKFDHERFTSKKKALQEQKEEYKNYRRPKELSDELSDFYSFWYIGAIFEASNTDWATKSLEEMAESLGIEVDEVGHALKTLSELGLLEKKEGRWHKKKHSFVTPKQMESELVRKYHREMGLRALTYIDSVPTEEREFGSITVMLTQNSFLKLRKKLWELREEVLRELTSEAEPDAVYQLNLQLVPLIKLK